jgi:catechol 2,3-dioxygenase-like lactoylglutathione lyase family enzyme
MTVQDVTVVSVPVSDQDLARAFYVDTLGFRLIRDDDSVPGIRWVQVAPGAGTTALTLVTWFGTMPAGSLRGLVLACDDLDAEYQRLEAAAAAAMGHRGCHPRPGRQHARPAASLTAPTAPRVLPHPGRCRLLAAG